MPKKGLGSGLNALFRDDDGIEENAFMQNLPLSKIEPAIAQPRERFDEEELQSLSDSIRQHGVLQPIAVRAIDDGYYQIIAGERRWRAARMAGIETIPARIIEADDREAKVLALVENLHRSDLNPVEQAKGIYRLIENYGFTQEAAAEQVGISRPAVANALRLLSLPESVLAMLEDGTLSAGHGRALLTLGTEERICDAADIVVRQQLSVRQTELLVKKYNQPTEIMTPLRSASIYARDLSEKLSANWGRKVKIVEGQRRGKLEIEYYGNDDLEELLKQLHVEVNE